MTAFADASAIVKTYVDEEHSDLIRSLARLPDRLSVSDISRVEASSALWRRHRDGALDGSTLTTLLRAIEIDWRGITDQPAFAVVAVSTPMLVAATNVLSRHALRASDAIQLACALAARDADPECTTFACFDLRLREAAAREGFTLLPAEV